MKKVIATPLRAISALALSLAASTSVGQVSPHEGWYQIEVLVFSRPLNSEERWPENINLDYPLNWEMLKDPEADYQQRLAAATAEAQALRETERLQSMSDQMQASAPADTQAYPAQSDASLSAASASSTLNAEPTGEVNTSSDEIVIDPAQALIDAVEPVDLARSERYRLPSQERNLNAVQQRINGQAGYRVLFHEAWRQYITGEDRAPWILIDGGDAYGEHRELEGSININVSRYLHIITDLWFTEFQINTGESRRQWPTLPENPLKRIERTSAAAESEFNSANSLVTNDLFNSTGNNQSLDTPSELDTLLADFLDAPYMPRQIYTLDQRRRMRSTELHYLDHPRLGLLIKILPYELPPEEVEEAELPATEAEQPATLLQ